MRVCWNPSIQDTKLVAQSLSVAYRICSTVNQCLVYPIVCIIFFSFWFGIFTGTTSAVLLREPNVKIKLFKPFLTEERKAAVASFAPVICQYSYIQRVKSRILPAMWSYAVGAVENAAYWPGNYTDVRGHWDNIMPVVLRNVASQWSHLQRSKKSLDSIQMALDAWAFNIRNSRIVMMAPSANKATSRATIGLVCKRRFWFLECWFLSSLSNLLDRRFVRKLN